MDNNRIKKEQIAPNQCIYILPPIANKFLSWVFASIIIFFFVFFLIIFFTMDTGAERFALAIVGFGPTILLAFLLREYATEIKITISSTSMSLNSSISIWRIINIPLEEIDSFAYSTLPSIPNHGIMDIRGGFHRGSFASFFSKDGLLIVNKKGTKFLITESLTTHEIHWLADQLNKHLKK